MQKMETGRRPVCLLVDNGIGDRLLDMIGLMVYAHVTKTPIYVPWDVNANHYGWGHAIYSRDLIDIPNVYLDPPPSHTPCTIPIRKLTGIHLCPYNVFRVLQHHPTPHTPNLTFHQVAELFPVIASTIQPSSLLRPHIPVHSTQAYGIHLRMSDKINPNASSGFQQAYENTPQEFAMIMDYLKKDMFTIISSEPSPTFFVCSEDANHRDQFKAFLIDMAHQLDKPITILPNHNQPVAGFSALYDMFTLSRCKTIYQGVKHSSFAVAAALIGSRPLVNYTHHLPSPLTKYYSINLWKPCLIVNNTPPTAVPNRQEQEHEQQAIMDHWKWEAIELPTMP